MATQIHTKSLSEELGRLLAGNRVNAALFSTYTFGRHFFETEVLAQITNDDALRGKIPVTVIVDRTQYQGSGYGYQVIRSPAGRLWHAKLILLMLTDPATGWRQTTFGLGSANLTRSGWEENQELFSLRNWWGWRVPKAIKEDLFSASWFRPNDFAVWCKENDADQVSNSGGARFLTNLPGTPLWDQLAGPFRSGGWSQAHIIAPFTEQAHFTELDPGRLTKQFFRQIVNARGSDNSHLHVHLVPSQYDSGSSDRVVAEKSVFTWLSGQPLKLSLYILQPTCKGCFHAKLFAFKSGRYWSVAAGSPNATGAAMTQENGNVEMVYEWKHAGTALPLGLLPPSRRVALNKLEFAAPAFAKAKTWDAVERATYNPKSRKLRLYWNKPHGLHDTRLLVNEKPIDPANFILTYASEPCLQCAPKRRSQRDFCPSFVPIEFPLMLPHELSGLPVLSPEDWLRLVGNHETAGDPPDISKSTSRHAHRKAEPAGACFDWAERVSRLDQCLASMADMISSCTGTREMAWIEKLLLGVWRSHDPAQSGIPETEIAWRKWVRAAFWQLLGQYDKRCGIYRNLADYHSRWQKSLPAKLKEFPIVPPSSQK